MRTLPQALSSRSATTLPFGRVALSLLIAGLGWVAARAVEISGVEPVNVTPSGFSLVFRASEPMTPRVKVYADALGTQDLAGQIAVQLFPIHTGNPDADTAYRRRASVRNLQQQVWARALGYLRVSECAPGTTYYYRIRAVDGDGLETWWPAEGPLPSVTTALETVMVPQAKRLLVRLEGEDVAGEIILLTSDGAAYPLVAVVGDGAGDDEAIFNLADFVATGGQTNSVPLGTHEFTARLPIEGPGGSQNVFALDFTSAFMVASTESASYAGREFVAVTIESVIVQAGDSGSLPIQLTAGVGLRSVSFRLTLPPSRLTELAFEDLAPQIAVASILPAGGSTWQISFDAKAGQVFSGSQQIARLTFRAIADQASAFLPLRLTALSASKPDGEPVVERYASSGRIIVLGNEPLLEALLLPDHSRVLNLYGKPGSVYALETTTDAGDPSSWLVWRRVIMVGYEATVTPPAVLSPAVFYRAYELTGDPPHLEAALGPNQTSLLTLYGQAGTRYELQSTTNLSGVIAWNPVLDHTLTNSFEQIQGPTVTNPAIFFRLVRP